MMRRRAGIMIFLAVMLLPLSCVAQQGLDSSLPDFSPASLPEGSLTSIGSDSMGGLMKVWVEQYRKFQPKVSVNITSLGSATAPPALLGGTADLGPMARPFKSAEREEFLKRAGFEPTQIRTALAAVGVYVHQDNPIASISYDQLERIYAANPTRRELSHAKLWRELGVKGSAGALSIAAVGRPASSYLNAYFKQQVLLQGEYAEDLMSTADSESMFKMLMMNPGAIAYGEIPGVIGKLPEEVRVLSVSAQDVGQAAMPTGANITGGNYPLSRYLNIYIVREPGEELDESLQDFLRFVLSKQGQRVVLRQGLMPLPSSIVKKELAKLN